MGEAAEHSRRPPGKGTQAAFGRTYPARSGADRSAGDAPVPQSSTSSCYHVRIDGFEGPFSLLLQVIARRKLEISEVDLADITGDFLEHLARQKDGTFDLDTATHFLVVAATLVELKAARLLPSASEDALDEILEEARDMLYARLLEYRAFRAISRFVAELLEGSEAYVGREVPLEQEFRDRVPHTKRPVHPVALAELAAAVLTPKARPGVSVAHIRRNSLTLREAVARLVARIGSHGQRVTFSTLVNGCSRSEQVVHFMALLELYKIGCVDLHQNDGSAPLEVECCDAGHVPLHPPTFSMDSP